MLRRSVRSRSTGVAHRRFRAMFGVSAKVCATAWGEIRKFCPSRTKPMHLLYGLLFLKVYGTESVHSALVGCDEKTFRK